MNEKPRVETVEDFKLRIAATYALSLSRSRIQRDASR
jgi:hypothetical protein